jgi:hypothetical protein
MTNDQAETGRNTGAAATTDNQVVERDANGVPLPGGTSTVRAWTSDFLLPSIRFREPAAPKIKGLTD